MTERKMRLPIPPAVQGYTWRPARREDIPAIYKTLLEIQAAGETGGIGALEELYLQFDQSTTRPEHNTLLGIAPDGEVAAMAWIFSIVNTRWEKRIYLWGEVHPAFQLRGLGDFILTWMETRGEQVLLEQGPAWKYIMEVSCLEAQHDRVKLFEEHHFQAMKHTFRMRHDLHQPMPSLHLPPGVALCEWTSELDAEILAAFNDAYSDDPHFEPFDEELWELYLAHAADFHPELSYLAIVEGDCSNSRKVVGFCMNYLYVENANIPGQPEGWIHDLGVMRQWRGMGIGIALTCASMYAFQKLGLDFAGLNVDAENLTRPMRLYETLGFYPLRHTITFEKLIDKSAVYPIP